MLVREVKKTSHRLALRLLTRNLVRLDQDHNEAISRAELRVQRLLNTFHVGSVNIWHRFKACLCGVPDIPSRYRVLNGGETVRIRTHRVSHIVELDDGSQWKIFPGDLDVTLNWKPDTDLCAEHVEGEISSHVLVARADKTRVRVIPATENWPVAEVKKILKKG
jgi:hypothetical protein